MKVRDRLPQVVLDPSWKIFEEYLQEERSRRMTALINANTHESSMELRGRIRELDTLLRLQDQLKSERDA